ncbi:ribosome maturation factor RimP [Spiroplasma litorale]|uniref:Ribosome maturation factor RimP n=1 Tax=Spiroplasma litorale TaxID=216942 RepID=A0A0K1W1G9_9MOLU|nr:hypothetical protein [Spiroplasma litorale]AKX33937.1 ribosome maturation factor RimP [Spiroplasma litorale]
MNLKNIIQENKKLIVSEIESCGLKLYEINFTKEFDSNVIQILVENMDSSKLNVEFDNLISANEKLSTLLDKIDSTDEKYLLEVSSAGAERKIKNEDTLKLSMGKYLYLKLKEPIDGLDDFNATLIDAIDNYTFSVNIKGRIKKIKLKWDQIEFIRFAIKF